MKWQSLSKNKLDFQICKICGSRFELWYWNELCCSKQCREINNRNLHREISKRWRQNHPDRVKSNKQQYYQQHKEDFKKKNHQYYTTHKEKWQKNGQKNHACQTN